MKDYNEFSDEYRDYIIKAYSKGIITGLPDGSFKPDEPATRAAAAAIISRMLDISLRVLPK